MTASSSPDRPQHSGNEFEHEPVPDSRRHSLLSVTLVWIGFPLVVTGAFLGSQLTQALGFTTAMLAIVLGNLILFGYVGIQSAIAARSGRSFSLLSRGVFGPSAARLVSGFLSTLVVGWFAVQTGLAGQGLQDMLGWSAPLSSLAAGVLFTALTMMGVRALSVVGAVSVPFFVLMGIAAVAITLSQHEWGAIVGYAGSSGASVLSIGVAITMVISLFIDSGTLTADFTRWARNPTHAVLATASAFPLANGVAMTLGAIVTAAGTASDGNFAAVVADQAGWLVPVAAAFFVVNCASVTMHCLYNAATGWSEIAGQRFRVMTVLFGAIGTVAAAAGVWDLLIQWLSLLGVVVPGIGGVMIAHFLRNGLTLEANPPAALGGWGIAIVAATGVNLWLPQLSVAVVAMLAGGAAYWLIAGALATRPVGARPGAE
ncbi:purine-cytosine permease-like protein [Kushneria sinocarnis]|uniref:Purine-cytosine permease-like protein n=1 Tax=Kushneria sinocarnis TaxID=595502 RepID=A0A420X199_9GAMM|nr:cytosine permease [Kushneria sinocarnis]RKR07636.1 purine-cytosine permease-like protein [Kushneria sinocarnis]